MSCSWAKRHSRQSSKHVDLSTFTWSSASSGGDARGAGRAARYLAEGTRGKKSTPPIEREREVFSDFSARFCATTILGSISFLDLGPEHSICQLFRHCFECPWTERSLTLGYSTINNITGRNSPKYQHERVPFRECWYFGEFYRWCYACNSMSAFTDRTLNCRHINYSDQKMHEWRYSTVQFLRYSLVVSLRCSR